MRFAYRIIRRFPERIGAGGWWSDQKCRSIRLAVTPGDRRLALARELAANGGNVNSCSLTVTLASRSLGNRDNLLKHLLDSLVRTTQDVHRVEILIKVDDDDDLSFYRGIKRKYQDKLNLRFLVSPRGRGYEDIHRSNAALVGMRSPTSRIWQGVCEGTVFTLPNWDTMLLSVLSELPHGLFIGTQCSFQEAISVRGPIPIYPTTIYHFGGEDYPTVGFELLEVISATVRKYPGWTSMGSTNFTDCFMSDLLRRAWERHGINLHVQLPRFLKRTGVLDWTRDRDRFRRRTAILAEFISERNQEIRNEIADAICNDSVEVKNRKPRRSAALFLQA